MVIAGFETALFAAKSLTTASAGMALSDENYMAEVHIVYRDV
jgi:hypothetical protein